MGVFKEFLEETLNLAFNPALNLFKVYHDLSTATLFWSSNHPLELDIMYSCGAVCPVHCVTDICYSDCLPLPLL